MIRELTLELTLNKNQRYLLKCASSFGQNNWVPDLVAEGNIALAKAYDTYTPEKGTFHSFALTLIKYAMMTFLTNNCRIIRIPNNAIWKNDIKQSYIHLDQPNDEGNGIDLEDITEDKDVDDQQMLQRRAVINYLHQLKPQYQQIIQGVVMEEKNYQDVATELGTTRENIRQQYLKAIKQLQKLMLG